MFLEGLIAAQGQARPYTKAEFLAAWAALDPLAAPDRKAISRAVGAVREELGAALPGGAARLEAPARWLPTEPSRMRVYVHSKIALLSARVGFDAQPLHAWLHSTFDGMPALAATAPRISCHYKIPFHV